MFATQAHAAAVDSQFKQMAPRSVSISVAITFQDSLLRVGERYCKYARRGMDGNDLLHIQLQPLDIIEEILAHADSGAGPGMRVVQHESIRGKQDFLLRQID